MIDGLSYLLSACLLLPGAIRKGFLLQPRRFLPVSFQPLCLLTSRLVIYASLCVELSLLLALSIGLLLLFEPSQIFRSLRLISPHLSNLSRNVPQRFGDYRRCRWYWLIVFGCDFWCPGFS